MSPARVKSADPSLATPEGAGGYLRSRQNQYLADLLATVARLGVGGLAAGAGARSLQSLASGELWGRPEAAPPDVLIRPHPVKLPVPQYGDPTRRRKPEEERLLAAAGMGKVANSLPLENWFPYHRADGSTDSWFWQGAPGNAGSAWHVPWFYPAAGVAAGAGLVAGYKGVGRLVDAFRRARRRSDVTAAEQQFRGALGDLQADPPPLGEPTADVVWQGRPRRVRMLPEPTGRPLPKDYRGVVEFPAKKAGDASLRAALDRLADAALTKAAQPGPTDISRSPGLAADYGVPALAAYLALATPVALGAGALSYSHFAAQDPHRLLADAIKQRARARWLKRPPEVYVAPVPGKPARSRFSMEAPSL